MQHDLTRTFWHARADMLLEGMGRVLKWVHAKRGYAPTGACMVELLSLRGVASIVQERRLPMPFAGKERFLSLAGISDCVLDPLRCYLGESGGYDLALPYGQQRSGESERQHGYALLSLGDSLPGCPA